MATRERYAYSARRSGRPAEPFFDLTVPSHAYLFGLLQTDGSHYGGDRNRGKVVIELAGGDEHLLHQLVELCPWYSTVRTRRRDTNFKADYETAIWTLHSWDARMELSALGLPTGRKAERIAPPMTEIAARDYVRGLIDGDGSVGFTQAGRPFLSFTTASESMARYFEAYAESVTGVPRRTNRTRRDGIFNPMHQFEPAATLAGHLYREGDLALSRKAEAAERVAAWVRPAGMRAPATRRAWLPAEDELVVSEVPLSETAERLGRTVKSVTIRRWRLAKAA